MQKTFNNLNIIFIAFLSSVLVYLVIGYALKSTQFRALAPAVSQPLFLILMVVSIGNLVLARMIKQKSFGDNPPHFDTPEKLSPYVTSKYMVMFALSEVPAIFGLVYFLLTGIFWRLVAFVALSLVSFALVKPSLTDLEDFQRRTAL